MVLKNSFDGNTNLGVYYAPCFLPVPWGTAQLRVLVSKMHLKTQKNGTAVAAAKRRSEMHKGTRPTLCGGRVQSPKLSPNGKTIGPIRLKTAEWRHFALFKKRAEMRGFALFLTLPRVVSCPAIKNSKNVKFTGPWAKSVCFSEGGKGK